MRNLLIALSLVATTPAPQSGGVTITYLASEGVLISDGTRKVLIDALFERYGPEYATPHDSTQRALAGAQGMFRDVDVILVTHRHGDHFHPRPMRAHLLANSRATLATSSQVIDSLSVIGAVPAKQILRRTMLPGARLRETVNGVSIEYLGIPHTGGSRHGHVEHLGYIVELGGRRILHLGDAGTIDSAFQRLRLDTARIDVALVPSWFTTEARELIGRWIKPKQVVAIHMGEGDTVRGPARVREAMPGADVFSRSLETRRW